MTTANKRTLKQVLLIFAGFGLYTLLVHIIPDGSLLQKFIAFLMCTALALMIVWFTPIGNPIKRWINKKY